MPEGRLRWVCLLLALPLALLAAEIRQYSRNTLAENGDWVSAKTLMQIGLVGAHHFVHTRNALAGNRLDLGAWHGYNEVYFAEPLTLGSVELSFRLAEGAHLSIVVSRDESSFVGARLSRHPEFPSMLFRGERSGAFTETSTIDGVDLGGDWHRARVDASENGWTVSLDGAALASLDAAAIPEGFVGLRNGSYPAEVDDVVITDATGAVRLDESFRNTNGYWATLAIALVAAWGLFYLIARLASRPDDSDATPPLFWVVLASLMLTFAAGLYLAFDVKVWSRSYFYRKHVPTASQGPATATLVRLESWRQTLVGVDSEVMVEPSPDRLTRSLSRWDFEHDFAWPGPHEYQRHAAYSSREPGVPRYFSPNRLEALGPTDEAVRITFAGSSQVVGAGAELAADSLVARLHRLLVEASEDHLAEMGLRLEILNVAVQSSEVPLQLLTFERRWIGLEPDLLLINLSYNDRDPELFESGLRRFAEIGEERGHRTVFVVEAMAADHDNPLVREKQATMRRLGRELDVPVIDLEAHMSSPDVRDSGFLWWDPVHMSSYAQHVAAEWLATEIAPHLEWALEERAVAAESGK